MFSKRDGKYWFDYGIMNAEMIYTVYVDTASITGDLNGTATFNVIQPGYTFEGVTYPQRSFSVTFDFSNRKNGSIRCKAGDIWTTFYLNR